MPSNGVQASDGTQVERNYWFYLLPQANPSARLPYAARLTEKAWRQGDRVCLFCDAGEQVQAVDDMLWQFNPESFLPHRPLAQSADPCPERIAVLSAQPDASDWETVIVLGASLPADPDRFQRLALIATSDEPTLQRARSHYRQLRELGIQAQIHDRRKAADN
jgi:DNA polymerase-3 subunit chi